MVDISLCNSDANVGLWAVQQNGGEDGTTVSVDRCNVDSLNNHGGLGLAASCNSNHTARTFTCACTAGTYRTNLNDGVTNTGFCSAGSGCEACEVCVGASTSLHASCAACSSATVCTSCGHGLALAGADPSSGNNNCHCAVDRYRETDAGRCSSVTNSDGHCCLACPANSQTYGATDQVDSCTCDAGYFRDD